MTCSNSVRRSLTATMTGNKHLGAKKRRSQDLMFAANHGLVASQANGDIRTDHVPGHGRSVPSMLRHASS
jgi:hypothetical protein